MEKGFQLRNYHIRRGSRPKDSTPLYPITKAENVIGGAGVTQVTELPAIGDEGKIYYNTTEKKYYTYTSEEGFSEIGNNNAIKQYVFPYQKTPCFFDSRIAIGPSGLDAFVEYDEENDLFLVKNGIEFTVDQDYTFNDAVEDLSGYYIELKSSMFQVISTIVRKFLSNSNGDAEYNFSENIDVLDLYSRDLASHGARYNWSYGSSWEFIIYTMRVVVNAKRIKDNFTMNASFTVLNKKVGSVGEYIIPQLNIVYNAIRKSGDPNELTVGYKTTIRHIGTMLGTYIDSSYADITSGATYFTDYNNGLNILEIVDDMPTNNPFLRDSWNAFVDIPLFRSLHISGRFYASANNISICLTPTLAPAQSNPSIELQHTYEFSIYDGIFNLIDVTPI